MSFKINGYLQDSQDALFKHMYEVMKKNEKDVFVDENDDGLKKVQKEDYAYLMESTSLLYYTERNCDVTMVGDLIDDRHYAIGMRKSILFNFISFLCQITNCCL